MPISIDIFEGDSGLTGDDDHVDINPLSGKRRLDFSFDLCALTLTGDINEQSQGLHQVSGGSAMKRRRSRFASGSRTGDRSARTIWPSSISI